ncbi:MAG: hypothetical protein QNJ40_20475 [Xanthomonadales bacterium]|nr:hypothetical protein [Xanthomonadales bacterium]
MTIAKGLFLLLCTACVLLAPAPFTGVIFPALILVLACGLFGYFGHTGFAVLSLLVLLAAFVVSPVSWSAAPVFMTISCLVFAVGLSGVARGIYRALEFDH